MDIHSLSMNNTIKPHILYIHIQYSSADACREALERKKEKNWASMQAHLQF